MSRTFLALESYIAKYGFTTTRGINPLKRKGEGDLESRLQGVLLCQNFQSKLLGGLCLHDIHHCCGGEDHGGVLTGL